MKTRNIQDVAKILELHDKMKLGYQAPSFDSPLVVLKQEVLTDDGQLIGAAAVKLIGETFLWLDPSVSKVGRLRATLALMDTCRPQLQQIGLEETSCWLPPHLEERFGSLLGRLGWSKSPWPSWSVLL